jgi:uncharacterized protein YndB with AHSA1/START domain
VKYLISLPVIFAFAQSLIANEPPDRRIIFPVEVAAPVDSVWAAWTTEAGVKSFFTPNCKVESRVDGAYEMYFAPDAPEGLRGGEGNKILAMQPGKLFSFTWNSPPTLPEARKQRTHVDIRFQSLGEKKTQITLIHGGWGDGGEWDKAFEYFSKAWGQMVLPSLQKRFTEK